MLKALVFDLDDTLLDTSSWLIPVVKTDVYQERIQKPLPLMPGARENLEYLKGKYQLFLLTQGQPSLQKMKVEALNLTPYFETIYFADTEKKEDKQSYFQKIAAAFDEPKTVMSIGNRRSHDVRLAKRQGLMTCLFDYGEHQQESILEDGDLPDFEVRDHFELVRRCRL